MVFILKAITMQNSCNIKVLEKIFNRVYNHSKYYLKLINLIHSLDPKTITSPGQRGQGNNRNNLYKIIFFQILLYNTNNLKYLIPIMYQQ